MRLFVPRLAAFAALAVLTSILMSCGARTNLPKRMELASLIEEAEKKAHLVNQFRAEFVKTRRNSVFNREMKVKGVLVFQKPDKFQLSISGDINIEVLSNGRVITLTHDRKHQEVFYVHGDRDLSKFADPLMLLIQSLGNGGLRQFSIVKSMQAGDTLITEVQPSNHNDFERVRNVILSMDDSGQLKKVSINFKSGDADETEFKSWTLLAQNDPEVLSLNDRLSKLSDQESGQEARRKERISARDDGSSSVLAAGQEKMQATD
jgi:outer membrane lipoprotein-sorting protein